MARRSGCGEASDATPKAADPFRSVHIIVDLQLQIKTHTQISGPVVAIGQLAEAGGWVLLRKGVSAREVGVSGCWFSRGWEPARRRERVRGGEMENGGKRVFLMEERENKD